MPHRQQVALVLVAFWAGVLLGVLVPAVATERTSCFTSSGDTSESGRAVNENCLRLMLTTRDGWQVVRQTKVSDTVTVFSLERPRLRLPA